MNALQEQYVVDTEGHKTAVILSLERYEQLLEDLHDLAIVAERREEEPISLEEMRRRLRAEALPPDYAAGGELTVFTALDSEDFYT